MNTIIGYGHTTVHDYPWNLVTWMLFDSSVKLLHTVGRKKGQKYKKLMWCKVFVSTHRNRSPNLCCLFPKIIIDFDQLAAPLINTFVANFCKFGFTMSTFVCLIRNINFTTGKCVAHWVTLILFCANDTGCIYQNSPQCMICCCNEYVERPLNSRSVVEVVSDLSQTDQTGHG